VSVVDAGDEVTEDPKDNGDVKRDDKDAKKEDSFIVHLHGLPYSASLEDIADFLEGCWCSKVVKERLEVRK